MATGHYKTICRLCTKTINQCRCPSKDKTIKYETCDDCNVAKPEVYDKFMRLRLGLLRLGVNLENLPPFVVTPQEFCDLVNDDKWLVENRDRYERENTRAGVRGLVFTVAGLRCMEAG